MNLDRFNTTISESEKTLREASDLAIKLNQKAVDLSNDLNREALELKDYFENQTVGLRNSYKKRLEQIEADFKQDQEVFSGCIQEFDEYYAKAVALFEKLEAEKNEFDLLVGQIDSIVNKKVGDAKKENTKRISTFENRITSSFDNLKENYDKEICRIKQSGEDINKALSVNEKSFEEREASINTQLSTINSRITNINAELVKVRDFSEALEAKIDKDYKYFNQLQTKNTKIMMIGFGMTGLFVIILIVGWLI